MLFSNVMLYIYIYIHISLASGDAGSKAPPNVKITMCHVFVQKGTWKDLVGDLPLCFCFIVLVLGKVFSIGTPWVIIRDDPIT